MRWLTLLLVGPWLSGLEDDPFSTSSAGGVLEERIDLHDPTTGAFLGAEGTTFAPDGRRMRLETTAADGRRTLLFILLHDAAGREEAALYFESEGSTASRENFTLSPDGSVRTTTYLLEDGSPGERTESDIDDTGREVRKRYFRADGDLYGEEDVLWNADGTALGWDFRYVGTDRGASFRYRYTSFDEAGRWSVRFRSRNGAMERIEARTLRTDGDRTSFRPGAPFAPGRISTARSETSPSFTADGRTMVFARYDDDWRQKEPWIATLGPEGWRPRPIPVLGTVYHLSVAPDGETILAVRTPGGPLLRVRRTEEGWSEPEDLTARYGVSGSYPCLTEEGDLLLHAPAKDGGGGIRIARRVGDGFSASETFFEPSPGTTFDAFTRDGISPVFVTRCFDDTCDPGPRNGVWIVRRAGVGIRSARKVPDLPYLWGVQTVPTHGILVATDGEEILAFPLSVVEPRWPALLRGRR